MASGTVDEYIAACAEEVRPILGEIRRILRDAVPGTTESIRYGMPAAKLGDGYHLYFAAWKRHVGLYPIPRLDEALEQDLAEYRTGKDTVRFLLTKPIPYELIDQLIAAVASKRRQMER